MKYLPLYTDYNKTLGRARVDEHLLPLLQRYKWNFYTDGKAPRTMFQVDKNKYKALYLHRLVYILSRLETEEERNAFIANPDLVLQSTSNLPRLIFQDRDPLNCQASNILGSITTKARNARLQQTSNLSASPIKPQSSLPSSILPPPPDMEPPQDLPVTTTSALPEGSLLSLLQKQQAQHQDTSPLASGKPQSIQSEQEEANLQAIKEIEDLMKQDEQDEAKDQK